MTGRSFLPLFSMDKRCKWAHNSGMKDESREFLEKLTEEQKTRALELLLDDSSHANAIFLDYCNHLFTEDDQEAAEAEEYPYEMDEELINKDEEESFLSAEEEADELHNAHVIEAGPEPILDSDSSSQEVQAESETASPEELYQELKESEDEVFFNRLHSEKYPPSLIASLLALSEQKKDADMEERVLGSLVRGGTPAEGAEYYFQLKSLSQNAARALWKELKKSGRIDTLLKIAISSDDELPDPDLDLMAEKAEEELPQDVYNFYWKKAYYYTKEKGNPDIAVHYLALAKDTSERRGIRSWNWEWPEYKDAYSRKKHYKAAMLKEGLITEHIDTTPDLF